MYHSPRSSLAKMRYFLYFLLGGGLVSSITYFGAGGRTMLAAFLAMLPVMTILTFALIHFEGGAGATSGYARLGGLRPHRLARGLEGGPVAIAPWGSGGLPGNQPLDYLAWGEIGLKGWVAVI
jgi:hypothetical protein